MKRKTHVAWAVVLALGLGLPAADAAAPSKGPVAISSCPFTINQPGSYVLTGNPTAIGDCLTVAADDVTIDLAGFVTA